MDFCKPPHCPPKMTITLHTKKEYHHPSTRSPDDLYFLKIVATILLIVIGCMAIAVSTLNIFFFRPFPSWMLITSFVITALFLIALVVGFIASIFSGGYVDPFFVMYGLELLLRLIVYILYLIFRILAEMK